MMRTYLLFLYGDFNEIEEILDYISINFSKIDGLFEKKFIVENERNVIIQFSTELNEKELSNSLYEFVPTNLVKFYFLFNKDNVVSSLLPDSILNYLFNNTKNDSYVSISYNRNTPSLSIDKIIDKIKDVGVENLTLVEKKFLNNFNK
jgi:biopolymer transport protein ExbD